MMHTRQRFRLSPDASLQRRLAPDVQQPLVAPRLACWLADGLSIPRQKFEHSRLDTFFQHHEHFVGIARQLGWPAFHLGKDHRATADGLRHSAQLPTTP
jgi:hypothetical protein